ncbi:MAG: hypothetical protein SOY42_14040 [Clostridium sp.]|nr:hypothetical protein [Clostridium sp.]
MIYKNLKADSLKTYIPIILYTKKIEKYSLKTSKLMNKLIKIVHNKKCND